ncbi:unnamed protein product [Linum trigynum]|uniref:Uncharacterized protein n=1 Tax=Linum trigynum TaxID=586398 RepID=A0AAV2F916_9ROSI
MEEQLGGAASREVWRMRLEWMTAASSTVETLLGCWHDEYWAALLCQLKQAGGSGMGRRTMANGVLSTTSA